MCGGACVNALKSVLNKERQRNVDSVLNKCSLLRGADARLLIVTLGLVRRVSDDSALIAAGLRRRSLHRRVIAARGAVAADSAVASTAK